MKRWRAWTNVTFTKVALCKWENIFSFWCEVSTCTPLHWFIYLDTALSWLIYPTTIEILVQSVDELNNQVVWRIYRWRALLEDHVSGSTKLLPPLYVLFKSRKLGILLKSETSALGVWSSQETAKVSFFKCPSKCSLTLPATLHILGL